MIIKRKVRKKVIGCTSQELGTINGFKSWKFGDLLTVARNGNFVRMTGHRLDKGFLPVAVVLGEGVKR